MIIEKKLKLDSMTPGEYTLKIKVTDTKRNETLDAVSQVQGDLVSDVLTRGGGLPYPPFRVRWVSRKFLAPRLARSGVPGMSLRRFSNASVLSLAVALTVPVSAQSRKSTRNPIKVRSHGRSTGRNSNANGIAQMGASVLLYDRYENLVGRSLSTGDGKIRFRGAGSGCLYLRVTLASFFPAIRKITVLAGSESMLQVSLSAVLSSIDLVPGSPKRATLMSDEWKWVSALLPIDPSRTAVPSDRAGDPGVGIVVLRHNGRSEASGRRQ